MTTYINDAGTEHRGGLVAAACSSMDAVRNLLFPRGCAGCDAPDAILCPECTAQFEHCRFRELSSGHNTAHGQALPVWAAAIYQGAVRHAILEWKDHDDVELDAAFASIMASLTVRSHIAAICQDISTSVLVVPLPSSRSSMRKRGRWHTLPLAHAVSKALCQQGLNAEVASMLSNMASSGRSVQQISSAQRAVRIGGNIRLIAHYVEDTRHGVRPAVILVDDIVTTGSTMRQCTRVCRQAGYQVIGALTLADVIMDDYSAL